MFSRSPSASLEAYESGMWVATVHLSREAYLLTEYQTYNNPMIKCVWTKHMRYTMFLYKSLRRLWYISRNLWRHIFSTME